MTRIGKLRGAGESMRHNMLSLIPGDEVDYRAEVAPIGQLSYSQSLTDGLRAIQEYDRRGPWVGAMYSLGCCVAVEAAARGLIPNCRGLVLVANPLRCGGQTYGIAGQLPVAIPHLDLWIVDDPITSLPNWDGSRAIAVALTGRAQPRNVGWLNAPAVVASLWRYTAGGRHTAYGVEKPRGETRTYIEVARDEAYRMAGVN